MFWDTANQHITKQKEEESPIVDEPPKKGFEINIDTRQLLIVGGVVLFIFIFFGLIYSFKSGRGGGSNLDREIKRLKRQEKIE